MGIATDRTLRETLIFMMMLLMLAGLFISRALLSISMTGFLFCTCVHRDFGRQFLRFFRLPFFLGMSLLFFLPLLSGLWSADKVEWLRWVRIKLPVFLLPLAFSGNWQLAPKRWVQLGYGFLFLVFAGCCWSLVLYFQNYEAIHLGYLKAGLMTTPLQNDHVRFSLLVCLGVICSFVLLREAAGMISIFLYMAIIFFVIYLHVAAARTGLLGLYIFFLVYTIHSLIRKRRTAWITASFVLLILLPLTAWLVLPTFQNRVRYMLYDLSYVRKDTYLPGANDGNRFLSLKAGWAILEQHPFGVGTGDVIHETYRWYKEHLPGMQERDKIYPSSEWLLYGAAEGWPGFLLFTAVMILPFFYRPARERVFWVCLNLVMACSLVFDIGLETQFGVFIYAFFILWWWKWLSDPVKQQKQNEL